MKERRVLLFAIATVLVIAAVAGVFWYLSTADDRAARDVELVPALIATAPISAGTTGQQALDANLIEFQDRERSTVPDNAVKDPARIALLHAAAPISEKQFITTTDFVEPQQVTEGGPLVSQIAQPDDDDPSSRQAVSITLDTEKLVDGNVQPGDIINIIAIGIPPSDEAGGIVSPTGYFMLTNVPVIGRPATGDEAAATGAGSLIVSLEPEQILQLVVARQAGLTLWTTLVPRDYAFTPPAPFSADQLFQG